MTVISYPIPPYSNPPIQPQYYQPSRFVISAITFGITTTVTTSVNHNYAVGQLVRLLIPAIFGSYQLNEAQGYVLSIPSANQAVVGINSNGSNPYIPSPYTAMITNITQASSAVITANNSFLPGNVILISGVAGMTQINGLSATILAVTPTMITININSTAFSAYASGGIATLFNVTQNQSQILAIGDINSGAINSNGQTNMGTAVPGSFVNISPL